MVMVLGYTGLKRLRPLGIERTDYLMGTLCPQRIVRVTALACLLTGLLYYSLARALPAYADTVVTNCTTAGLQTALSGANGTITFNCGAAPVVITVTDNGGLDALPGKKFTMVRAAPS